VSTIHTHSFNTPIGTIRTAATVKGLALVALPNVSDREFEKMVRQEYPDCDFITGGETCKQAEREIGSYLDGRLTRFTVPLDIRATPFQERVLKCVAEIPYGQTITYGEIARSVGSPGASRAVGMVNAKNKLPLIIPCHRVVASNGLGGYGGGVDLKSRLLNLEGALKDELKLDFGHNNRNC
jgi:O-6-methylguanine DNA methyltransferase